MVVLIVLPAARVAALLGRPSPAQPVYLWLADQVRALILDGRLLVGDVAPSERSLAAALGLGRITVSSAYTLLRQEGYLSSRPGARTRVCLPDTPAERPDLAQVGEGAAIIDLTLSALPGPPILTELTQRAAAGLPRLLAGPGLHPLGLAELRDGGFGERPGETDRE